MAELAEGHPGLASEQAVLVVCSTQVPEQPLLPLPLHYLWQRSPCMCRLQET